jgi:predicted LPLAT superfamily acyltransferase
MSQKKDVERKRGNWLGFWFFQAAVHIVGLRGAYGLLYFVSLYYLVFDRAVVAASRAYVRRRFPDHGVFRQLFDVYLLFVSQGKSLIDRHYVAAAGKDINLELVGYEKINNLLTEGHKGLILLTAHVGNWQVAMTSLGKLDRDVYLMMRREDNAAVKDALNIDSEKESVRIIYTDGAMGGVIEALKAINRGDIVSIMGDRTYGFGSMEAALLGGNVRFPYGAFSLASAAQCPVAVLLSAKVGNKHVTDVSHVIKPPAGMQGNKDTEIHACVQEFARVLKSMLFATPTSGSCSATCGREMIDRTHTL